MENITRDRDGEPVVLSLVVPPEAPPSMSQEKADDVKVTVGSIINQARDFGMRLGLPGLLVYNGVRSSAVGAAVGFIYEGSTFDRAMVGVAAGGLNLIASQTFWAAMAIAGVKVGGRIFSGKRRLKVVP